MIQNTLKVAAVAGLVLLTGCASDATVSTEADEAPLNWGRLSTARPGIRPERLEALIPLANPCGGAWERDYIDEALALRTTGRARREGTTLIVGKSRFRDGDMRYGYEPGASYDYVGVYADSGVDLVHAQFYEGDAWILVDPRNGAETELSAMPIPSPGGTAFVAASSDEYNFYGVEIVERTSRGWVRRARFDEKRIWDPCAVQWIGERKLRLKARVPHAGADPEEPYEWSPAVADLWKTATITRNGGSWQLDLPAAP